ncbi:hypothetical protein FRC11_013056, partial [Ceratobasidium sp. 423]
GGISNAFHQERTLLFIPHRSGVAGRSSHQNILTWGNDESISKITWLSWEGLPEVPWDEMAAAISAGSPLPFAAGRVPGNLPWHRSLDDWGNEHVDTLYEWILDHQGRLYNSDTEAETTALQFMEAREDEPFRREPHGDSPVYPEHCAFYYMATQRHQFSDNAYLPMAVISPRWFDSRSVECWRGFMTAEVADLLPLIEMNELTRLPTDMHSGAIEPLPDMVHWGETEDLQLSRIAVTLSDQIKSHIASTHRPEIHHGLHTDDWAPSRVYLKIESTEDPLVYDWPYGPFGKRGSLHWGTDGGPGEGNIALDTADTVGRHNNELQMTESEETEAHSGDFAFVSPKPPPVPIQNMPPQHHTMSTTATEQPLSPNVQLPSRETGPPGVHGGLSNLNPAHTPLASYQPTDVVDIDSEDDDPWQEYGHKIQGSGEISRPATEQLRPSVLPGAANATAGKRSKSVEPKLLQPSAPAPMRNALGLHVSDTQQTGRVGTFTRADIESSFLHPQSSSTPIRRPSDRNPTHGSAAPQGSGKGTPKSTGIPSLGEGSPRDDTVGSSLLGMMAANAESEARTAGTASQTQSATGKHAHSGESGPAGPSGLKKQRSAERERKAD